MTRHKGKLPAVAAADAKIPRARYAAGIAALLVGAVAMPASAQPTTTRRFVSAASLSAPSTNDAPTDRARLQLRRARADNLSRRKREGWWLFGWGVTSLMFGGVTAAILHDREGWLGYGLTTAGFGAINAGLALGMLDLSGKRREAITAGRLREETQADVVRQMAIDDQRGGGQVYALNLGLDVAYVTAGVLMFFLGRSMEPEQRALSGAGVAMISQGAFLLGFDLAGWIHTARSVERLETSRDDLFGRGACGR